MVDILVQPGDDNSVEDANAVVETFTVQHDMDPAPTPLDIQTILTADPAGARD